MATKKIASPKSAPSSKSASASETYVAAVGRRKTATAQVRFFPAAKSEALEVSVNGQSYITYFKTPAQRQAVEQPLKAVGVTHVTITVMVRGGGLSGQADAVKLGIARALVAHDELQRPLLKAQKLLTRDPRAVERKKPGLKKARRAPQWSKR